MAEPDRAKESWPPPRIWMPTWILSHLIRWPHNFWTWRPPEEIFFFFWLPKTMHQNAILLCVCVCFFFLLFYISNFVLSWWYIIFYHYYIMVGVFIFIDLKEKHTISLTSILLIWPLHSNFCKMCESEKNKWLGWQLPSLMLALCLLTCCR